MFRLATIHFSLLMPYECVSDTNVGHAARQKNRDMTAGRDSSTREDFPENTNELVSYISAPPDRA